jgi:hypothetical protein
MTDTFRRSPVEQPETPVFAGESGDGGNRTHEPVHPSRIPLGRTGLVALLDPSDAIWASRLKWHTQRNGDLLYVARIDVINGLRERTYLHRMVLGLERDDPRRVDHINRNTLDNRRSNLRIVTDAQNAQNQGSRGGSSRFRGVTWDKSREKWMATGMLDGRRRTIGRFDDEAEAAFAAAEWRAEHMPFSEEAAT